MGVRGGLVRSRLLLLAMLVHDAWVLVVMARSLTSDQGPGKLQSPPDQLAIHVHYTRQHRASMLF